MAAVTHTSYTGDWVLNFVRGYLILSWGAVALLVVMIVLKVM